MKKLLSLLASISVIGTTSTTLVSFTNSKNLVSIKQENNVTGIKVSNQLLNLKVGQNGTIKVTNFNEISNLKIARNDARLFDVNLSEEKGEITFTAKVKGTGYLLLKGEINNVLVELKVFVIISEKSKEDEGSKEQIRPEKVFEWTSSAQSVVMRVGEIHLYAIKDHEKFKNVKPMRNQSDKFDVIYNEVSGTFMISAKEKTWEKGHPYIDFKAEEGAKSNFRLVVVIRNN